MKIKHSLLSALFALLLPLFLLSSCEIGGTGNGSPDSGGSVDPSDKPVSGFVLSSGAPLTVVMGEGADAESLSALRSRFKVTEAADGSTVGNGARLILGRTDDAISEKAYRKLSRMEHEKEDLMGYCIYASDGSVAIAFDEDGFGVNAAEETAIAQLLAATSDDGSLELSRGVYLLDSVDFVEYQAGKDQIKTEEQWQIRLSQLQSAHGLSEAEASAIISALRGLYSNYTDDVIDWFANLYEPTLGGWYYSNSARDTMGFLPDIESTSQALDFISGSGLSAHAGGPADVLPEWMHSQIVYFFKSRQEPNGYFYHPQWTREAVDSNYTRRGRDLNKAVSGLAYFGAMPTYDTPIGVNGDGITADEYLTASLLAAPIGQDSVAAAVSRVLLSSSDGYVDPILVSSESFAAYLATLDINGSPYKTSSVLSTWTTQIVERDKQLRSEGKTGLQEVYFEWLEGSQNPKTGLWTTYDEPDYEGVNGLLKISGVWSSFGRAFPHALEAARSTLHVISKMTPEDVSIIVDVYNTWYAVLNIIENVQKYNPKLNDNIREFRREIVLGAVPAIENTARCVAAFSKPDGSFSFSKKYSSPTSSGMYVALSRQEEGDVNATELASVGTVSRLFKVLGMTMVPLYTESDMIRYVSILNRLSEVVKDPLPSSEPYTYDDDLEGSLPTGYTTLLNSTGEVSVVKRPDGSGNALSFVSRNNGYDYVIIPTQSQASDAACYVLENDFMVTSSDAGYVSQLQVYSDIYMIGLSVTDENRDGMIDGSDGVYLSEESSSSSTYSRSVSIGRAAAVGEWFNLRIELYTDADGEGSVRVKIYLNGTPVGVSDNYYDANGLKLKGEGKPKTNGYQGMRIIIMSSSNCSLLLDNSLITQTDTVYKKETDDALLFNVDAPDKPEKIYGFENGTEDITAAGGELVDGEDACYRFGAASEGSLNIPVTVRTSGSNCNIAEMSLTVDGAAAVGTAYELILAARGSTPLPMLRLQLAVKEVDGEKRLALFDGSTGSLGAEIKGFSAPLGEELVLRIEYYQTLSTALIYLNGELTAVTDTLVSLAANRTYAYLIFNDRTPVGKSSGIAIDEIRAEMNKKSYDKATEPEIGEKKWSFSTADGLTLSGGAAVKGGRLSFSSAGTGAYALIPINERSPVITVTRLQLTLNTPRGTPPGASFRIAIENKAGEALIVLELRAQDGAVMIYEASEGRTALSPIASIPYGEVTLGLEYSPLKDVACITVNDEAVGVTSLTYYTDGRNVSCDFVRISIQNGLSLTVDNLLAESKTAIFRMPAGVASPDKGAPVLDFEGSNTGNAKSLFTTDLRSGAAFLRIKEANLFGEYSKVLKYTTGAGANDSLYIPVGYKNTEMNAMLFEADVMLNADSSDDGFEIYMMADGQYVSRITLAYSGGKIAVNDNTGGKTFISGKIAEVGEWFRLRYEFMRTDTDYTGDGAPDALVRLYVNGEYIGSGYNGYASYRASDVNRVRIYSYSKASADIHIDNVKIASFGAEPDPAPEVDEGRLPGEYYGSYGGNGYDQYSSIWTDVDKRNEIAAEDKDFARNNGTTDASGSKNAEGKSYILLNSELGGNSLLLGKNTLSKSAEYYFRRQGGEGSTFVYETSLLLDPVTDLTSDDTAYSLWLGFTEGVRTAADGAQPTFFGGIRFYAKANGNYILENGSERVEVKGGEWFNLRVMLYTEAASDRAAVAVYINGEQVSVSATDLIPESFTHVGFIVNKQVKCRNFYFDNTACLAAEVAFEGSVPELDKEQGTEGGTTTDPDNPEGGTTTDPDNPEGGTTTDPDNPEGGTTTDPDNPEGGDGPEPLPEAGSYYELYGGLAYSSGNAYYFAKRGYAFGTYVNGNASPTGYTLYDKTGSYDTSTNRLHLNIQANPKDAANKLLWMHRHNTADRVDLVFSNRYSGLASGNCLVFETDFILSDTTGVSSVVSETETADYILDFRLSKTGGSFDAESGTGTWWSGSDGALMAAVYAKHDGSGGFYYYLTGIGGEDTSEKGGRLEIGTRYTITLELYDDGKVRIYVDGNYVSSKTVIDGGVDVDAAYDSVLTNLRWGMTGGAGAYFDNTFVGIIEKN